MIHEGSLAAGQFAYASSLSSNLGNVFTFTTGPVVPPGDMVCYISTTGRGRIYADSFTVTTNAGVPSALAVSVSPAHAALLVGMTATFTVAPSGGNGFYTCQWYQTGVGRLAGQTNATLVLNGVTAGLNGSSYYVAVNDGSTTADSMKATLTVTPRTQFLADQPWPDNNGVPINAHGGGILFHDGVYYWFGESYANPAIHTPQATGVHCYSSADLYNWTDRGVVLARSSDPASEIGEGSIIERPKVIYNAAAKKFVMWFHLELAGHGYSAARSGVAVADKPIGPFKFLRSERPNAGVWPLNVTADEKAGRGNASLMAHDFAGGQMARDMTLFVDDDGKAYHIFASEDNGTMHISQLSDDYLSHSGKWIRALVGFGPGGSRPLQIQGTLLAGHLRTKQLGSPTPQALPWRIRSGVLGKCWAIPAPTGR